MRTPSSTPIVAALAFLLVASLCSAAPSTRGARPASHVADSLVATLRQLEAGHAEQGADAALVLGQLHFARGEYRLAADAFSRAAARLEPARKPEARYWVGISWLGFGDASQARAALEEVAASGSPRRPLAQLGLAEAWELAGRPERAREVLENLLMAEPGEAGPAALARLAALADAAQQPDAARRARQRLLHDYPASYEAAGARLTETPGGSDVHGGWTVEIGSFSDAERANSLADRARRAGFPRAAVVLREQGAMRVHSVVIGRYESSAEAKRDGERAAAALGVGWRVGSP